MGPSRTIGTPVRCPACRHSNLAIDIWCERCGRPLDWQPTQPVRPVANAAPPVMSPPPSAPAGAPPQPSSEGRANERPQYCWSCGAPNRREDRFCGDCGSDLAVIGGRAAAPTVVPTSARDDPGRRSAVRPFVLPRLKWPVWQMPHWRMPTMTVPRLRTPVLPRTVLIAALVLAVLLIVPVVMFVSASGHPTTASRQLAANHLPTTSGTLPKAGSPEGVAIGAVQAKTGLKYSSSCRGTAACLSLTGQNLGQGAAAFVFATAKSGGRECVSYVVQANGAWHPLGSVLCALPNQVSPLIGRDATVHVPGNCANVHAAASVRGGVVSCLSDGTAVHVDGGPTAADGFVWWHTTKGWIAHDFLVGP
ncbi:MAG TPA: zinc ribbon domain-containing protein [Candidatus Dormibacteraeota bacterium]